LILPTASYRADDFLAAARRLGVEAVVASDRGQALADAAADTAIEIDLEDPDRAAARVEALAARRPLDAVVAVDEPGVRAAAAACARLGLRGNPTDAVAATRAKPRMRAALGDAGVPQPDWRLCGPDDDPAAPAAELGFPVVVKAPALSGSRGVIRADDAAGVRAAAARARAIVAAGGGREPAGPLLVERYLPGREVAVEGLLSGGRLEVLAVFDKPDPLEGPYFEETIYVTPSRLPPSVLAEIELTCADAAAALDLREGPVHAELRVDGERVAVLELAARSIGGLCSRVLRFGLGLSLEELILRHALGRRPVGAGRQPGGAAVMMLPIPGAGVLRAVEGREEALAVPGVEALEVTIPLGRPVRPLPEGDRYLGFLFARGEGPAEAEAALRAGHARLEVVLDPGGDAAESGGGASSDAAPLAAAGAAGST
jgi:biotin carboxylase